MRQLTFILAPTQNSTFLTQHGKFHKKKEKDGRKILLLKLSAHNLSVYGTT